MQAEIRSACVAGGNRGALSDLFEDDREIFDDWLEYYEDESLQEQAQDIARIIGNYLRNETRLIVAGWWLRRSELQFLREGKWTSIYS